MNNATFVQSEERLRSLINGGTIRYVGTETSAVTTSWGVNWSEVWIARDIMQNFFDANRERLDDIHITVEAQDVTISAPAGYNLQRLFYLGSEKGTEDIGQYGEGFKVAATCLLRDHNVAPVAISGNQALCLRIAEEPVPGTQLFPLVYDFFELENPLEGTQLVLAGCSSKLVKALQSGLTHFFYPANALLGERLWASPTGEFMIYASRATGGHVFYQNLLRGDIPHMPLILVINKEYKLIEDKIKSDRDRNAFGEKLMDTFYKTFARNGVKGSRTAVRILVKAGKECWEQGHPLLSAVSESPNRYVNTLLDEATVKDLFENRYFARSHCHYDTALQLRCNHTETQWERDGKIGLPAYFAKFGVMSAMRHCRDLDALASQESRRDNSRPPTMTENASLKVLHRVLALMSPQIANIFARKNTTYTVAQTDVVLGELKRGRQYRSLDVFLAEQVFEADFAGALAVFLHEHAHIFGHDGDRGFTDALTELIETVISCRADINNYEAEWEVARMRVKAERNSKQRKTAQPVSEQLARLSEGEVRDLLLRIPEGVLIRAMKA